MKHSMRLAAVSDSESILNIYAPYITDTAVSFETEIPAIGDFSARIAKIAEEYPFVVYEMNGKIIGYAYASRHRERAAYRFDVDVSIYVLPEYHGLGIACKLYDCLFALLKKLGYINAYAAYTESNGRSMKFHQKFGFTLIGVHHKTGYKLGRWHDVTWLEKTINAHDEKPGRVLGIGELSPEYLENLFRSYTIA